MAGDSQTLSISVKDETVDIARHSTRPDAWYFVVGRRRNAMKQLALLVVAMLFTLPTVAIDESKDKPTQHLQVADVESMEEAKAIFLEKTAEMRTRRPLDLENASKIHIATYTLEKSAAFFAEHLTGEKQELAKEIAVVVEDIHIASEGNKLEELKENLNRYFDLVDRFIFCF